MIVFIAHSVTVHDFDDLHDTLRDAIRSNDLEILATMPCYPALSRVDCIDECFAAMVDDYAACCDPDTRPRPDEMSIVDYPPENETSDLTLTVNLVNDLYGCIVVKSYTI